MTQNQIGLFETMRAYRQKIIYLDGHLERLKNSARLIGIRLPRTAAAFKKEILKKASRSKLPDAYVRLTVYAGQNKSEYSLLVREYQPYPEKKYREGFRLGISRFRQNEFSFFCRLKICDRMLYELALKEAREAGFDEAIILNSRGYISEASRSNIFLSRKKELFTPALSCGCLDGITRRVILDLARRYKVKSNEGNFTLKDLEEAEGAFLTNSLIGLMPLKDKCAGLTRFFLKKYRCLLK